MKQAVRFHEYPHNSTVNCATIGRKAGRLIAAGTEDKKVVIWAVGKPSALTTLDGHPAAVRSVAFDATEELVAVGTADGTLKIWDLLDSEVNRSINAGSASIEAVDFHPYGIFVATGDSDGELKVWDTRTGKHIQVYKAHTGAIWSIKFSPDGRWLASADAGGVAKIWDLLAGKQLSEINTKSAISAIEFHPTEIILGIASEDGTLKIWNLESFETVATLQIASGFNAITFHPEGTAVVSASQDTAKILGWDPVNVYDTQKTNWGSVKDVAVTDGGFERLVAVSAEKGKLSVFVAPFSKLNAKAPAQDENQPATVAQPTVKSPTTEQPHREQPVAAKAPRVRRERPALAAAAAPQVVEEKAAPADHEDKRIIKQLDLSAFLPDGKGGNSKIDFSSMSDSEILDEMMKPNPSMCSILNSRVTKLKVVRNAWGKSDVKGTVDAVAKIKDHAVLVDIMNLLLQKKELFSLEICARVFPILGDLLSSPYEEYIVTALSLFKNLVKNVGLLIKTTRDTKSGANVSEDRLEQSNACFNVLLKVNEDVGALKKRGGKVGAAARDFTKLPEFTQFFKQK